MIRLLSAAALLALLTACGDGQPFEFPGEEEEATGEESGEDGGSFEGDGTPPPGTEGPEAGPDESIFRSEERDDDLGGFVTEVAYNAASDTFSVDNIPFDGDRPYERRASVRRFDDFAFYESVGTFDDARDVRDPRTGERIEQFDYRAIYGVSRNEERVDGDLKPRSRFAIVRTGGYIDYGFGGFVYERNGDVELPESGQAVFAGDYAGIRVFNGAGGLEYTSGDALVQVDFEDFNDGDGVDGTISNRRIYDANGNPVPLRGNRDPLDDAALVAPTVRFKVNPDALRGNGEISGEVFSQRQLESGDTEIYEEGTYLGIIGGEADEIVGIVVIDSTDPRDDSVSARETGGFIVYR